LPTSGCGLRPPAGLAPARGRRCLRPAAPASGSSHSPTSPGRGQDRAVKGRGMREQTALITGASSGIGGELAKLAAGDGCNLVLASRRQERLESLARELSVAHGVSARVLTVDLADPKASERIAGELEKERVAVDVLVNNAGLGLYGSFSMSDLRRQLEVLQV